MNTTFKNFKKQNDNNIHATGYFFNKWDINYSTILSELIFNAGRYCEAYSSDLFIDWYQIEKELNDGTIQSQERLFGFRKNGVDHSNYIFSHYNNNGNDDYYRKIYKLDIVVTDEKITMDLYEVYHSNVA